MPFGTIVSGSNNFEPRSPGVYSLSTVAFGDPSNEFRLRGSSGVNKSGNQSASITRYVQKDVTVGGDTVRKNAFVTLNITMPSGTSLTATEIDNLIADISTFATSATITRLLMGES